MEILPVSVLARSVWSGPGLTGGISRKLQTICDSFQSSNAFLRYWVTRFPTAGSSFLRISIMLVVIYKVSSRNIFMNVLSILRFVWHTFIVPIGGNQHRERMDNFYKGQADIYDETRRKLLKGRKTMLRLSAAQLVESRKSLRGHPLIWVDIGGGTGYNIEAMHDFLPIETFDAVYLVDICEPLLIIARKRFAERGWKNIHVVQQDAASFALPETDRTNRLHSAGVVSFVTLSYSLSMIPDFYTTVDHISQLLSPNGGLLSVVDFYTSGTVTGKYTSAADIDRKCAWFSRWFWQIWFDFDHVMLGSQRREYLEHKFETLKVFNGRNKLFLPFLVRIPYYIWLGQSRSAEIRVVSCPTLSSVQDQDAPQALFRNSPYRIPYTPQLSRNEMETFIYSFTWEDPYEDLKYLEPNPGDSLLLVTSAGDNALHYAAEANFQTIHCVDLNPCQGHLLELKLAALRVLPYESFFDMFGYGRLDTFQDVLDYRLSPILSAPCYQFWRANSDIFSLSAPLYMHGYSGNALRFLRALFKSTGRYHDVQRFCSANSIADQEEIWNERIRPVLLNPLTRLTINNPVFCWKALGVPRNQRNMLLAEGATLDYIKDTLDPIASSTLLRDEAYHYLLTLLGHYTPASCPLYLSRRAFDALRANDGKLLSPVKIHTDTISGALRTLPSNSLARAILMDHMDWFSKEGAEAAEEIGLLQRVLKPGGFILLRSAARAPWYIKRFASSGFEATCLNVRRPGSKVALDRVNMYASFWKVKKRGDMD